MQQNRWLDQRFIWLTTTNRLPVIQTDLRQRVFITCLNMPVVIYLLSLNWPKTGLDIYSSPPICYLLFVFCSLLFEWTFSSVTLLHCFYQRTIFWTRLILKPAKDLTLVCSSLNTLYRPKKVSWIYWSKICFHPSFNTGCFLTGPTLELL